MDETTFTTFFAAQFDDVWRFARRRCTSADQADDVAAETFAVAWRRHDDLPPAGEARLWLFGTARLVLANQRRSDRRRAGLHDRMAAEPAPRSPDDPADLVADADTDGYLWSALASLSDADRDLLVMRAWDELAVTDIATLLGCTPNAASLRLHKARTRLADALAAGSVGSPPVGEGDLSRPSPGRPAAVAGPVAPPAPDPGPDLTATSDRVGHVDIDPTDPGCSRTSNERAPDPEGGDR